MTVPDFQTLMRPLLECASDGKEVRTSDCIEIIADNLKLSQEDRDEMLPSGKQPLLMNRIHWARTYLGKAKVITSTRRGHFVITDRGRELLENGPERITIQSLENFSEFQNWRNASVNKKDITPKVTHDDNQYTPEEIIEHAYSNIDQQLKADILENLYNLTPTMFEQVLIDVLITMGYGGGRAEMGKALGKTNDNGVDGIIKEDELGLDVVYVQAKKYEPTTSIGRPDIQSFVGSLEGFNATKGIFVTTAKFANTVDEYVKRIQKRIVLIDGERLADLMVRHNVGVRTKKSYEVKFIDEEYFSL
ncbi:MAG: restriction endonuclease [Alphaproteobacteria bacterium]